MKKKWAINRLVILLLVVLIALLGYTMNLYHNKRTLENYATNRITDNFGMVKEDLKQSQLILDKAVKTKTISEGDLYYLRYFYQEISNSSTNLNQLKVNLKIKDSGHHFFKDNAIILRGKINDLANKLAKENSTTLKLNDNDYKIIKLLQQFNGTAYAQIKNIDTSKLELNSPNWKKLIENLDKNTKEYYFDSYL